MERVSNLMYQHIKDVKSALLLKSVLILEEILHLLLELKQYLTNYENLITFSIRKQ